MALFIVPPPCGMGVEDQRDRGARAGAGAETAFETAFGPWEDDFGHCTCAWNIQRNARG